ncbi:hypothetical protein ACJJTC_010150 [Scirpophaga incertulas]
MLLFLTIVAAVTHNVVSESCFYHRCLSCYQEQAIGPGSVVNCHPSNWVTAQWIHNLGHPPTSTDSIIPIEHQCLKMVATPDDKSYGNTVDVIRGCVPRAQIDSVCLGLVAVERARGHSDARCFICRGDNCNSGVKATNAIRYFNLLVAFYVLR